MTEPHTSLTLWETMLQGGWTMIPLALCSLISLAVIVERLIWGPRRERIIPLALLSDIEQLVAKRSIDEAIGLCRANKSPLANIVLVALRNAARPRQEIVELVEAAGRKETLALERYLGILGTIAAIAPLIGLLGTIFGMIDIFSVIGHRGLGDAPALAGGISEALITTATGLVIAIPSAVFYRYFAHKANSLTAQMEIISLQLVEELTAPATQRPAQPTLSKAL